MGIVKVKINDEAIPAIVRGKLCNPAWDGRSTMEITLEMTYQRVMNRFVDGAAWSIISSEQDPDTHEIREVETDCSAYSLAGDVTDHRDGTVSVLMGKETDLEEILEMIYGGNEE